MPFNNDYKAELDTTISEYRESQRKQFSEFEVGERYTQLIENYQTKEKEIKKLKKEIEDLEEEIEELEDDKKSERRKYDKKLSDREEAYRILDKSHKELEEQNKSLQEAKEDLEQEKKVKAESINFINEILNAKNTDSKDYQKVYDKTTEICNYIENDVVDVCKNILKIDTSAYKSEAHKWRNTELKTWLKGKKVIAVVGEFSSGKTSLVNKILNPTDDKNIVSLPTSSKETTAIPTYIEYAPDFYSHFMATNGDLKRISIDTFQMTKKEILDQVNVLSLIQNFVLGYKNENIRNISILDTPGFGSNNKKLIEKTVESIREASAVFWVVDVNTGEINQSSIKTIKEHLQGIELYVILNKCDTKSPNDIQILENKVKETIDREGIKVAQYIRFSTSKKKEFEHCVPNLLKLIGSLNTKRETNFIQDLKNTLAEYVLNLNGLYDQTKRKVLEVERQKDKIKTEFGENIRMVITSCSGLERLLEQKSDTSILGFKISEGYYKLTKQDKERYDSEILKINTIVKKFEDKNKIFGESLQELGELETTRDILQNDRKRLKEVSDKLNELIDKYKK
ncbi:GTPase [Capnocytophaga stomatis]|uniref:dynamin family protein n=1 Tax=Capnocytophaga stomatis TaxID=1848904 RepID=UPI0019520E9D|nr:dynamin family protein [Capnocytophaga stomatis]GIJ93514.1 GTPase [Capnocytophaga stomatis]